MSGGTPWRFAPSLFRGNALADQSGFPHKRHSDLRLAFSPLHLEQRLYIFPVNHCVMSALPPRMTVSSNTLMSVSDKSTPSESDNVPGTFGTAEVSKPGKESNQAKTTGGQRETHRTIHPCAQKRNQRYSHDRCLVSPADHLHGNFSKPVRWTRQSNPPIQRRTDSFSDQD